MPFLQALANPNAIAIDPSSGKLLVADAATGLVRRLTVDSAGTVTNDETIAEDLGTFSTIQGIAATAGGDVLFAVLPCACRYTVRPSALWLALNTCLEPDGHQLPVNVSEHLES